MKTKIPWNLFIKILDNSADSKHIELFNRWIEADTEHQEMFKKVKELWNESGTIPVNFSPDAKAALLKVKEQLGSRRRVLISREFIRYAAAASIILLVGIGLLFFNNSKYTKISTGNTKTELVLSDGSHIWLNENSYIKYPKTFKNIREVRLQGEAYFEIAKNPQKPFVVDAGSAKVKVLGTHFNVRSVHGEQIISVVVSEGKVAFSSDKLKNSVFLTAGDKGQLFLSDNNLSKIKNDDVNFLSWKTGEYIFEKKTLEEITALLARNYNAQFEFRNENLRNVRLNITFKNKSLKEIVEILASTMDEQFDLEDDKVIISSKK